MKILLINNNQDVYDRILVMMLKSFKYEVVFLKDVENIVSGVKSESPDLILIDKSFKGQNGLDISKAIKDDFLTAYIPVIILIDRKQARKELLEIEQGVDDYLIKPPDPIDLQIRIEMAVRRTIHQFFANALTHLPGNRMIELAVKKAIYSKEHFCFGYIDIDKFKYFNDCYGYLNGDMVIVHLSQIISRVIKEHGNKDDFVGHIGGDDFVFITTPDREKTIALEIIKEFDRLAPYHYSDEDRNRGFIAIEDRQGELTHCSLMSLSVVLVNNQIVPIHNMVELIEIAFEIKKHLKGIEGSKFLPNRRSQNKGLHVREKQVNRIQEEIRRVERDNNVKPLGQILLEAKLIEQESLNSALVKHWHTGESLGQVLVKNGIVSQEHIEEMLKLQKNN